MKPERLEKNRGRKRPVLKEIYAEGEIRGYYTPNELVILATSKIKNLKNRLDCKAMDDAFSKAECTKLINLIETFVSDTSNIVDSKKR